MSQILFAITDDLGLFASDGIDADASASSMIEKLLTLCDQLICWFQEQDEAHEAYSAEERAVAIKEITEQRNAIRDYEVDFINNDWLDVFGFIGATTSK